VPTQREKEQFVLLNDTNKIMKNLANKMRSEKSHKISQREFLSPYAKSYKVFGRKRMTQGDEFMHKTNAIGKGVDTSKFYGIGSYTGC